MRHLFFAFVLGCALLAPAVRAVAQTVEVQGGGDALQAAIDAAQPDDEIVVTDSLEYRPVRLGKRLTVRAADGQEPKVVAEPGVDADGNAIGGDALLVFDQGREARWVGIDLVQNQPGGAPGHNVVLIAQNEDEGTLFTMEDTRISMETDGDIDARLVFAGDATHFLNCTFVRTAPGLPNPLLWLGDRAGGTIAEGCTFGPQAAPGHLVVLTYRDQDTGPVTFRDTTIGGGQEFLILSTDVGGHEVNVENCSLAGSAIYVGNLASTEGTVWNVSRTVLGPTPQDRWLVFSGDGSGAELSFTNCAFLADGQRGTLMADGINGVANDYSFVHCTFAETAPLDGRVWLTPENNTGSTYDFRNCIIRMPGSQNVSLINGDVDIGPATVSAGANLWHVGVPNPNDPALAVGEIIEEEVEVDEDGYHLVGSSIAVDHESVQPNLTVIDIDGEERPQGAGSDFGCDEFPGGAPAGSQVPGDCNQDGLQDISDPLCLLAFLFLGGEENRLPCGEGTVAEEGNVALLDWNGDGGVDLTDGVGELQYLFASGAPHPLGSECTGVVGCPSSCQ